MPVGGSPTTRTMHPILIDLDGVVAKHPMPANETHRDEQRSGLGGGDPHSGFAARANTDLCLRHHPERKVDILDLVQVAGSLWPLVRCYSSTTVW